MAKRRIPGLRRSTKSRRESKRRFTLFCEGKNTEPEYFFAIKRKCTGTVVEIKVHRAVGAPITIARKAIAFAKAEGLSKNSRRRKNSFEERDEVWAVFDKDEHSRYKEAISNCHDVGVKVAVSNPCFELWLILHIKDWDQPVGPHDAQRELGKLRPEYHKKGSKMPDCDDLVLGVMDAEQRGEILLKRREDDDNPCGNPSTTVGRLTKVIREADELARRDK